MSDKSAENLRRIRAWDAEWDESKHSRADNGQFTSGGGGGAKKAPEYGGYTPPKFHGTKEQIFKQATAQVKKNAARAAVLANATPVKAKFSKKEQDVLKGTDASEKDIQKLIGQIPHMSDPEAWSRVHDFCFSDEQADQVFKILKSKAAKAAKPAAPAKSKAQLKKEYEAAFKAYQGFTEPGGGGMRMQYPNKADRLKAMKAAKEAVTKAEKAYLNA